MIDLIKCISVIVVVIVIYNCYSFRILIIGSNNMLWSVMVILEIWMDNLLNIESVYLDQEVLGIECITSRFGRHWLSRTVQM